MKNYELLIRLKASLAALFLTVFCYAQQGINYQGVTRNANGQLMINTEVTLDFNIKKEKADGEIVFSETHIASTDDNGVFSVVIGKGTPTLNVFEDINWAEDQHFLNVWMDGIEIGTTPFSSIPYTQAMGKWQAHLNGLSPKGTGGSIYVGEYAGELDDFNGNHNIGIGFNALRRNTTGGVNIALGYYALRFNSEGFGNTALGIHSLENNTTGYSNIAIGDAGPLRKNSTGGNNIGLGTASLFYNTSGNHNIAIGFRSAHRVSKGNHNIALGYESFYRNTSGSFNLALGYQSMYNNTSGQFNVANGYKSLFSNTEGKNNIANGAFTLYNNVGGENNIASGYQALYNNKGGSYNIANGAYALFHNTGGNNNIALGQRSLGNNTGGSENIAFGLNSLQYNTIGNNNIAFGIEALKSNKGGNSNIAIGKQSLESVKDANRNIGIGVHALNDIQNGINNIGIGWRAGDQNKNGSNNLFLGTYAGWNETGSNKLYISHGPFQSNPLIYGEFDNRIIKLGGKVTIGAPTPDVPLHIVLGSDASLKKGTGQLLLGYLSSDNLVLDKNEIQARSNGKASILYLQQNGGKVYIGNSIVQASDKRLKKDITDISYGLADILKLRPTEYFWKDNEQQDKSLGLIAQEVEKVIKNIVTYDENLDRYGVNYTALIPVLIKALQEQQEIIDKQNASIEGFETRLSILEARMGNK